MQSELSRLTARHAGSGRRWNAGSRCRKSMNEVCFAGMEEFNEEVSSSEKSRIRIGRSASQSGTQKFGRCVREAHTRPTAESTPGTCRRSVSPAAPTIGARTDRACQGQRRPCPPWPQAELHARTVRHCACHAGWPDNWDLRRHGRSIQSRPPIREARAAYVRFAESGRDVVH